MLHKVENKTENLPEFLELQGLPLTFKSMVMDQRIRKQIILSSDACYSMNMCQKPLTKRAQLLNNNINIKNIPLELYLITILRYVCFT